MIGKYLTVILIGIILPSFVKTSNDDVCRSLKSCSSCLSKSYCDWCVTKSECTNKQCGTGSVIYPRNVYALLAGTEFCPRIVDSSKELTLQSGKTEIIVVKITQIYVYMAYTPWKCRIDVDGNETIANAVLVSDEVFCGPVELTNDSETPYVKGNVSVSWGNGKYFDGTVPIQVCRCDLDPDCVACSKMDDE